MKEVLQRKRDELVALLDVPPEHRTPDQQSRVQVLTREYRASKRKRKKRRKRRLPRSSSLFSPRRRLRQWHLQSWFSRFRAGFTGDDVPRVMFPSGVARPKMLRIMAGMVQKDSCSGMARLVLLVTVHLVLCFLPSLQARDAWHHGRYGPGGLFRHVQGLVCWYLTMSFALCSSWLSQAQDARLHGRHGPQDSLEVHRCSSWTRFSTCPLCAMYGVMVQTVQYSVWRFRSCSSSRSSTLPLDAQWQLPMVQTSADHRDSPVRIWWSMSLFAGFSTGAVVDRRLRSHSCSPLTLGLGVQV